MANYYDGMTSSSGMPYIERATLLETIKIPVAMEQLTLGYFDPEFKDETYNTESGEDSYVDRYYEFDTVKAFVMPWDSLPTGIQGKFSIPILLPSTTDAAELDAVDKDARKATQTGFKGSKLVTSSYQTSNYVTLTIPRYMLYQFIGVSKKTTSAKTGKTETTASCTIPKGTVFLVSSYGGKMDSTRIRIIGLYSID